VVAAPRRMTPARRPPSAPARITISRDAKRVGRPRGRAGARPPPDAGDGRNHGGDRVTGVRLVTGVAHTARGAVVIDASGDADVVAARRALRTRRATAPADADHHVRMANAARALTVKRTSSTR
jgi:hypothetical protein